MEAQSREPEHEFFKFQQFEAEIVKGLSGPSTEFTKEDWDSIRDEVIALHRKRMQEGSA